MDNTNNRAAIPKNEDVINDLTKHLECECNLKLTNESSSSYEERTTEDSESYSETEDDTTSPPKSPPPDDDYVDEDALKAAELALTADELEKRKQKSAELKAQGNKEFKNDLNLRAVRTYTDALLLCPLSCTNERSVLYCNRAAAKIKLGRKPSAIDDCTKAVELNDQYVRAYLRRAKLYEESDKLDESLVDYKKVLEFDPGNPDARVAVVRLPPLINERNEKLKEEMLGKLKDLGNLVLKPFGLSTNNFKLQQDPNTGGYSVNFQQ